MDRLPKGLKSVVDTTWIYFETWLHLYFSTGSKYLRCWAGCQYMFVPSPCGFSIQPMHSNGTEQRAIYKTANFLALKRYSDYMYFCISVQMLSLTMMGLSIKRLLFSTRQYEDSSRKQELTFLPPLTLGFKWRSDANLSELKWKQIWYRRSCKQPNHHHVHIAHPQPPPKRPLSPPFPFSHRRLAFVLDGGTDRKWKGAGKKTKTDIFVDINIGQSESLKHLHAQELLEPFCRVHLYSLWWLSRSLLSITR